MNTPSDGNKRIAELEKELQMAKEDLLDLELYVREFSTFLPLPVCTVNPLGIIIDSNESFGEASGLKIEEIIGEYIEKFFMEKEEISEINDNIEKESDIRQKELTFVSKEGRKFNMIASVSSRNDKDGSYIGYFLAMNDISEIRRLEDEMRKKMEDLERFNKLMVGRELKMIELKKELRRQGEESENNKKK